MHKATVKSCGCRQCKRGRRSAGHQMKLEERAARHKIKQDLKKKDPDDVVISPAHHGSYTD